MKELEPTEESKKTSKTQAVTSQIDHNLGQGQRPRRAVGGVQWLEDRRGPTSAGGCHAFGDVPLNLEYKLEEYHCPNSTTSSSTPCGAAKIAKECGRGGPLLSDRRPTS